MREVFIVQHVHEFGDGNEDVKMIGVYSDRASAEAAVERLSRQPGFRDCPEGFHVDAYRLGEDHWTSGYVNAFDDVENEAH
ncbi:hypothetical protein DAERI_140108 [Deinococcus aerius]|uniref:DUF7336 domain-containing protein n=1 Tax=Deinococcus aerius TaxID=200253 RepID=A0A2I9DWN5_9DEIO|nr:hypothetical protein [Deinococcus aerius]GBF07447.1 hypothetical protein DAERI_140108 [Deinococcus aerius]